MPPSTLSLDTASDLTNDAAHGQAVSHPAGRRTRNRSWIAQFLRAPFEDIDDRVRVARR